jgi:UTP--glucose-1-phosphate uridylyltransferase
MRIEKAVIPAAGFGTRFLPASKAVPKELLPIVDKPTIQYIAEEVIATEIPQLILVTGREKGSIEDHFDISFELEHHLKTKGKTDLLQLVQNISEMVQIVSVRQKMPLGLGHAILCAKQVVGNHPFAVLLADDIVDADPPCLRQMIDTYHTLGSGIFLAIKEVPRNEVYQYGIIDGEKIGDRLYKVRSLVEKPSVTEAPSNLAVIGRYLLPPEIFEVLEHLPPGKGGEIQLTDAIAHLGKTVPIYGYQFEGDRYDAGDKMGFFMANVRFGLKHPELGPRIADFIKKVAEEIHPTK